ncbi:2OG-Fe(II) oxygenase [Terriglobus saanensis]|uniref:2OG-Fe(II) oxygenase n=1 Tax=Terriglobus saanensis (strain ATCC BAA-1853 / DSM 23119 / SP1PR4) TaxID=401053 RepID=E8V3J9_TERSS|nr:2OG-Fe(II) oxygenase [Terriglobus saanensis]ADV83612.1 2OG-Fe(II) oxygenase [Terriglobus saanensis SP1PR4]
MKLLSQKEALVQSALKNVPGLQLIEGFLSPEECNAFIISLEEYRKSYEIPLIYRPERKRSLKYRVINGEDIQKRLPTIQKLYESILPTVQGVTNQNIVPLKNRVVGVNINFTPPGGAYRWHYDRNAVTAVLYLNEVDGGEIEAYPDYRFLLKGARSSRLQGYVDRLLRFGIFLRLGRKCVIAPKSGRLVIMRGDRCLHSVRTVSSSRDRICIVMSFDFADAVFSQELALDSYLYSSQRYIAKSDPNYSSR